MTHAFIPRSSGASPRRSAVPGRPPARRDHLRLVGSQKRAIRLQRRRRALVGAGVLLTMAVVFGLVSLHVISAEKQLALNGLAGKAAAAQADYENLRLQVAQLESPAHILAEATRLGMRQPASVRYLQAPAGSVPASQARRSPRRPEPYAPAGDADWPKIKSDLSGSQ